MEGNHSPFDMLMFQYMKAKEIGVSQPPYCCPLYIYLLQVLFLNALSFLLEFIF